MILKVATLLILKNDSWLLRLKFFPSCRPSLCVSPEQPPLTHTHGDQHNHRRSYFKTPNGTVPEASWGLTVLRQRQGTLQPHRPALQHDTKCLAEVKRETCGQIPAQLSPSPGDLAIPHSPTAVFHGSAVDFLAPEFCYWRFESSFQVDCWLVLSSRPKSARQIHRKSRQVEPENQTTTWRELLSTLSSWPCLFNVRRVLAQGSY